MLVGLSPRLFARSRVVTRSVQGDRAGTVEVREGGERMGHGVEQFTHCSEAAELGQFVPVDLIEA